MRVDSMAHISIISLKRALRWHPAGLRSWSLSDWYTALAGECGEAGNVIKKLNRVRDGIVGNKETPEQLRQSLGDELADVYLYLDLLAQAAEIDLPAAIERKFNAVSERHGFPERL
jgi:NTP pyrophosphatase (non-canonical NTP hydrolase)